LNNISEAVHSAAYRIDKPSTTVPCPLVFESPHSWRYWPPDGHPTLASSQALQSSWDAWMDELWVQAADGRAPVLSARFHRAYIDANRHVADIDAALLDGVWPTELRLSDAGRRGMGLIRRYALPGVDMYASSLSVTDVQSRIARYHQPYRLALFALQQTAHQQCGYAVVVSAHSMKSTGNAMNDDPGRARPDIVVSDLDGTSAHPELARTVANLLRGQGYVVNINHPYKGGELTRACGNPSMGFHAVQIEVNRALYMNEHTFERHDGFASLANAAQHTVTALLRELDAGLGAELRPSLATSRSPHSPAPSETHHGLHTPA
jgi:N-formylglutamate deformylase